MKNFWRKNGAYARLYNSQFAPDFCGDVIWKKKEQEKRKNYLGLFIETFYLSAFTFGGGYMIVSLMKKKFVNEYHWIEEDEMLDLVAIAQCNRSEWSNRCWL